MVPPHLGQMRGLIVGIGIEAVVTDHNLSLRRQGTCPLSGMCEVTRAINSRLAPD